MMEYFKGMVSSWRLWEVWNLSCAANMKKTVWRETVEKCQHKEIWQDKELEKLILYVCGKIGQRVKIFFAFSIQTTLIQFTKFFSVMLLFPFSYKQVRQWEQATGDTCGWGRGTCVGGDREKCVGGVRGICGWGQGYTCGQTDQKIRVHYPAPHLLNFFTNSTNTDKIHSCPNRI